MQVVLANARSRKASTAFCPAEAFLGLVSVNILDGKLKEPFFLRAVHDGQEVLRSAVVHDGDEGKAFVQETVLWMLAPSSTGLKVEARNEHGLLGALVLECDLTSVSGVTLKKWCPLFRSRTVIVGELLISVTFRISEEGRQKLAFNVESDARSLAARRAAVLERARSTGEELVARVLKVNAAAEEGVQDGGYYTPSLDVKLGADLTPDDQRFNMENHRFQQLLDEIATAISGDHQNLVPLYQEVQTISQDFIELATFYGHIIISELHLPVAEKTIKPSEGIGGMLGGQKFLVHNILFKCPDAKVFAEYPDPLSASMKVAGHELKGMQCLASYFLDKGTVGAHLPLAALIDSRGHRLLAISALPVSGATLIYGSDNASTLCEVKQSDAALKNIVTDACLHLGLKIHTVVNGYDATTHTQLGEVDIASPIDLEGHKGLDGRYYLVDCSRLMPPLYKSNPAAHDKCWPYYAAMRPEFLFTYTEALSPDAFSLFSSRSTKQKCDQLNGDMRELRDAAAHFKDMHLPLVAKTILGYWMNGGKDVSSFSLKKKLHINGVNVRFLGTMIAVMRETFATNEKEQSVELIKRYECEVVARAGKNSLRTRLRAVHAQQQSSGSSHLAREVVLFVNEFVGTVGTKEWCDVNSNIIELLESSFDLSGEHLHKAIATFLDGHMLRPPDQQLTARAFVLERMCEMTGINIVPEIMEGLRQGRMGFKGAIICLALPDVSFACRVKHLNVVDHAAGFVLFHQGLAALDTVTKVSYFKRAQVRLVAALNSSPFDARGLTLAGDINLQHMILETDVVLAKQLGQRAKDYFTASICVDPLSSASRRSFAELKALQGDLPGAEELFLQALELSIGLDDHVTLGKYANFLNDSLHAKDEAAAIMRKLQAESFKSRALV